MARARAWNEEDLRRELPNVSSLRQLAVALGLAPNGGASYSRVRAEIERLSLSTDHFSGQAWNKGTGKGRDPELQRASKKRWYDNNREVYSTRNKKRRQERIKLLRENKKGPCVDCGKRFPYFVMEFDHRDGSTKEFELGAGVARMVPLKKFLAEMEKCDLVCVLCHRYRTARRAGWDGIDDGQADSLIVLALDS